jgi:hypothetical protein
MLDGMKTHLRLQHRNLDVACELDTALHESRYREWQVMREEIGFEAALIPQGAQLWIRPDAEAAIRDLVRREARCCGFLDFEIVSHNDSLRVDITSPSPLGAHVAVFLAGLDAATASQCC